jgi:hypothetical protein
VRQPCPGAHSGEASRDLALAELAAAGVRLVDVDDDGEEDTS